MNDLRHILALNISFLSLLYTPLARSEFLEERAQFHTIEKIYDSNADGKADGWALSSYNGDVIRDMRDHNGDGVPDEIQERFTIKNVIVRVVDSDFDRHPEQILYLFPKKTFFIVDTDGKGAYDRLEISDVMDMDQGGNLTIQNTQEIPIQLFCDASIKSLLAILEAQHLAESISYVRGAITERYEELSALLKKASDDKSNVKLWAELIDKTRVYLDLPNNTVAPLHVELMEQKNTKVGASYEPPNKITINITNVADIGEWLRVIDHEMTHMIQHMRIFSYFRRDGLSWKSYAENPKYYLSSFAEALALYADVHLYLSEAEAYLHNGRRELHYRASLQPTLNLCVQLKLAEMLAFHMAQSRISEVSHFVFAQDLLSPHQKALFGYISENAKEISNMDMSLFDKNTREIIQRNVETCVHIYENLGSRVFNKSNDIYRDFWTQDRKAYIQTLENILSRGQ